MATGLQSRVADLLVHITADTFGQVPAGLLRHIIDTGSLTLDELIKRANVDVEVVRHGVMILLHHNIINIIFDFPTGPQSTWKPPDVWPQDPSTLDGVIIRYKPNFSGCLSRIRYPRAIDMVHELLGYHVAVVLKVLLQQGMASYDDIYRYIKTARDQGDFTIFDGLPTNDGEHRQQWMDQLTKQTIEQAFRALMERDYIQRVPTMKELAWMCYENQKKKALNKLSAKQSKTAKAKGRAKSKTTKLTASEEALLAKTQSKDMDDIFLSRKSSVARRGKTKNRLEKRVEVVPMKTTLTKAIKGLTKTPTDMVDLDDETEQGNKENAESVVELYQVNIKGLTFDLVKLTMEDLICVRFVNHNERVLLRLVVRTLLQESLRLRPKNEMVDNEEDLDKLIVQEVPVPFMGRDNSFLSALEKRITYEENAGRIDLIERSDNDEWSVKIGAMLHELASHPDGTVTEQIDTDATLHCIRWQRVKVLLKRRLMIITLRRMIGTSAARVWNGIIQYYNHQYVTDVDVADLCLVSQNVARSSLYALENLGLARAQATEIVQSRQSNLKQSTPGGWVYEVDEESGYQRGFHILISSVIKLFERREFEMRKVNLLQNDTSSHQSDDEGAEMLLNSISNMQQMAKYAEDMLETYILLLDEHLSILNEL